MPSRFAFDRGCVKTRTRRQSAKYYVAQGFRGARTLRRGVAIGRLTASSCGEKSVVCVFTQPRPGPAVGRVGFHRRHQASSMRRTKWGRISCRCIPFRDARMGECHHTQPARISVGFAGPSTPIILNELSNLLMRCQFLSCPCASCSSETDNRPHSQLLDDRLVYRPAGLQQVGLLPVEVRLPAGADEDDIARGRLLGIVAKLAEEMQNTRLHPVGSWRFPLPAFILVGRPVCTPLDCLLDVSFDGVRSQFGWRPPGVKAKEVEIVSR